MVSGSNDSHPTDVVKAVYEHSTFQPNATAVYSNEHNTTEILFTIPTDFHVYMDTFKNLIKIKRNTLIHYDDIRITSVEIYGIFCYGK